MVDASATTRKRLADRLRDDAATPSELGRAFDLSPSTIISHLEHVARSLESTDEQLLVAPPRCQECGFDSFDQLLNRPSRCPECRFEGVTEPTVTIEPVR
ncbi:transcriptional regulator [Halovivax gelatinilyticus]|uniref:transcriptional regulator n=1 Tax=Halovivax gelatinilyticus TaxID=2961597 RepID=UPI0020CA5DAF|nr:transcriptional regulator [Halovivax gelatinilyticus]